jgi:succinoglycan biosynthesis protein ExoM
MERIDVCVCTFRRPSLIATIESIAGQDVRGEIALRIIVADNDGAPTAQVPVEEAASRFGVPITYVHAPARNISVARNACLDAADTRWIAFIDDDEVAAPDWLRTLIAARAEREVVFGRSQAILPASGSPKWMQDGHFHHNAIGPRDGALNGYTCNVLIDLDFVVRHGIRFQEALGQTGGEDTVFFDDVGRAGGRAGYVADALVLEGIPAHRASLKWLARRRFRAGQIHCLLKRRQGVAPWRLAPVTVAKMTICYAAAALMLPVPRRSAEAFLRGTLHLGFLSSALGARTYAEYGAPPAT